MHRRLPLLPLSIAAIVASVALIRCSSSYTAPSTDGGEGALDSGDRSTADGSVSPTTDGGSTGDAGAALDCTLSISPTLVRVASGSATLVTVSITRAPSFVGSATIAVNALPSGFSATSLAIPSNETSGTLSISAPLNAAAQAFDVELVATQAVSCGTARATVAVPGAFAPGATMTMPTYLGQIGIEAWGAGGGPGIAYEGVGGNGGAGGYVSAVLDVSAGDVLTFVVGTPGGQFGGGGAGAGGGCTEVLRGGAPILVAPGGGGGGRGANNGATGNVGGPGGGGENNGGDGDPTGKGGTGASAGTSSAGGAAGNANGGNGGAYDGGAGASSAVVGKNGVPGGGAGGGGGGGGGCGFFGGGGGGDPADGTSGGGGGAGGWPLTPDGGTAVGATGALAPQPVGSHYGADAGAGGSGGGTVAGKTAIAAASGRVIVIIP